MAVRYYPSSKVKTNLTARSGVLLSSDGKPYSGKYYATYDGQYFSGPDPKTGPNERLTMAKMFSNPNAVSLADSNLTSLQKSQLAQQTNTPTNFSDTSAYSLKNVAIGRPTSYFPKPTESDYKRGFITRYFTKKKNEKGYVIEISKNEYADITNGTANYDVSIYQVTKILWKLTGPLKSQRQSQYNIIPGIIDTNQRLTEESNKTFLGIVDFIGGEYDKFARPTP